MARQREVLKDFDDEIEVVGKGVVVLVGDVEGGGEDLARAGGAAEGEDGGDVHGVKGCEEGVCSLALAGWWHGSHGRNPSNVGIAVADNLSEVEWSAKPENNRLGPSQDVGLYVFGRRKILPLSQVVMCQSGLSMQCEEQAIRVLSDLVCF